MGEFEFRSPVELGLTVAQREAFVSVLRDLEEGNSGVRKFCMNEHHRCMFGLAESRLDERIDYNATPQLHALYFARPLTNLGEVKPEHAAQVLRTFLKTGSVKWDVAGRAQAAA